ALGVSSSELLTRVILGNPVVFYGLLFAELVMVWTFSSLVRRVGALAAGALFLSYAVVNGLTLSVIFLVYTRTSIATTFFVTGGTFAAMSAYGYLTKRDLSGLGHFAMMGLIGLVLGSLVNLFLKSPMLYWLTTFAGVIVFTGLVAYDTQKIKELNVIGNAGTDEDHKEAIHGALILYLDFVNLFLYLLRILGRRR
ncbi:MAG: Bax inhibitor-1/YccA family protein, partial [Deltaproteobacteria bacterium]|nr:Bax inhibitor-1/YccA family protein [Deltaproteobacteria bacterium]